LYLEQNSTILKLEVTIRNWLTVDVIMIQETIHLLYELQTYGTYLFIIYRNGHVKIL